MIKVLFVAAGPVEWGSSRMRCWWPAAYMEDAEVVTGKDYLGKDAEVVIFQKVFDAEYAQECRRLGRKVFWDVCDPTWWWQPKECQDIVRHVDGVVCSSDGLREDFSRWCSGQILSYTIRDRMELRHYPNQRVHTDADPVRLIWFGMSQNRWSLLSAMANLERLAANGIRIEMTILDDMPGDWRVTTSFPIYTVKWSLGQENEIISNHDLAVLPPYPGPWGKVKSNNKQLTAWACGLPVVSGMDYGELVRMMDWSNRAIAARMGQALLVEDYQVNLSAREWEALLG